MDPTALRNAFEQLTPALNAWGKHLTATVVERVSAKLTLEGRDPDLFFKIPPKPRVKTVESFIQKALYRNKDYRDPLNDITDKVGTRFVVLLNEEVNEVSEVITQNGDWTFRLDRDFEFDKKEQPTHFDYQSKHYVVTPKNELLLDGVLVPAGTACEVQIRTLLQHAYAELSHDRVYKPQFTIENSDVYRKVAKGMALIETTGDIFTDVARSINAEIAEVAGALRDLASIYLEKINVVPVKPGAMETEFLKALGDLLSNVSRDAIEQKLKEKPYIVRNIRERSRIDPFYKSVVAPATYMLVDNHHIQMEQIWPFPARIREEVYSDLGYSTES